RPVDARRHRDEARRSDRAPRRRGGRVARGLPRVGLPAEGRPARLPDVPAPPVAPDGAVTVRSVREAKDEPIGLTGTAARSLPKSTVPLSVPAMTVLSAGPISAP